MRRTLALLLAALAAGAGAWLAARALRGAPAAPPAPVVVERIRETARLEALEVLLYRKVSFVPEPVPRDSVWADLAAWVGRALRPPRGRAIVFARARLGLDLSRIGPGSVALEGGRAWVVLPPLEASVEILPGETEVIDSNLDSSETAQLLELARQGFLREVEADPRLRERALRQAERAIRELLRGFGVPDVRFVDRLPGAAPS
jgi:hypothetical protein